MKRVFFTAAVVLAMAIGVPAQQPTVPQQPPPQQSTPPQPQGGSRQQPSFRVGVELVSLNVTVTDGTSRYVTDLETADFNVFEDGVKQDVTFFNKTNLPIALALLLDTSASIDVAL